MKLPKINWKKRKLGKNFIIIAITLAITTILNICSIISTSFSDFYRKYIFNKIISNTIPAVTGFVGFSVGEIMIILGIMILLALPIIVGIGFFGSQKCKKVRKIYLIFVMYVLVFIYVTETMNCFIMYRTSPIDVGHISGVSEKDLRVEKLLSVYNHVAEQLNNLSGALQRDEKGYLISDFTYEDCKKGLLNLSESLPLLSGYYPNPKKILNSDMMSQQYLAGIYFPFSMEANFNKRMYCANMPATICHELSHLKGYIREDEANFVAYLACISSDNDFVRYSGYLSVLDYLLIDLKEYGNEEIFKQMTLLCEEVVEDDIFLKEGEMEEIEENAVISGETLQKTTDQFIENTLQMNGVTSGMDNYNEVVKLLIQYYQSND